MTAEVNAVADMGDIAVNLPQPRADELTRAIDEYLRTVVNDELPMMAEGRVNPATTRALTGLWVPLGNYEPQAEWEVSIREIAINKAMDIGERRRQRVVFSRERVRRTRTVLDPRPRAPISVPSVAGVERLHLAVESARRAGDDHSLNAAASRACLSSAFADILAEHRLHVDDREVTVNGCRDRASTCVGRVPSR